MPRSHSSLVDDRPNCGDLAKLALKDTAINTVAAVPADSDIQFEVWMPATGWNGKPAGNQFATLLGSATDESFPLYRAISQDEPEVMAVMVETYRSQGYTKFQLKVGPDVETDIARIFAAAKKLHAGGEQKEFARGREG